MLRAVATRAQSLVKSGIHFNKSALSVVPAKCMSHGSTETEAEFDSR